MNSPCPCKIPIWKAAWEYWRCRAGGGRPGDPVGCMLIRCQQRCETVSFWVGAAAEAGHPRPPRPRVRAPGSSPLLPPPPCGGNTESSSWMKSCFYLTIVCIVVEHHRLVWRPHFTSFVMHMSASRHVTLLLTAVSLPHRVLRWDSC